MFPKWCHHVPKSLDPPFNCSVEPSLLIVLLSGSWHVVIWIITTDEPLSKANAACFEESKIWNILYSLPHNTNNIPYSFPHHLDVFSIALNCSQYKEICFLLFVVSYNVCEVTYKSPWISRIEIFKKKNFSKKMPNVNRVTAFIWPE